MTQAIFLSYASQNADAARRICDSLRAAGLEVWFDQSELRGGDAWDASIRKQIKECALFVPVISGNTQARAEGYFRLEWRLADQRTHLMAKGVPFILPVTIDGTSEAGALVPDAFMEVQWTKLSDGASIAAFATRVVKLVDGSGSSAIGAPSAAPNRLPRTGSGGEFANRGAARTDAPQSRTKLSGENWIAIVAVVFGIGAGVWFMVNGPVFQQKKRDAATASPASTQATPAPSVPATINPLSVMVMPFANQTGDKDKSYIADALTSSITSDLSRIVDASIVPAATAFSLRDKNLTVPQLGKEAAVRFVLTGGVTSDKEKLRINAALSDTQTGAQLWAENFDGRVTDLFALQDQVTNRIGNTIGPQMIITAARESEKRASTPQVADLLMRARALWLNQQSLQNHQAMEALYRQALALDPNNLRAKAGLAQTLGLQVSNFSYLLKLDGGGRIALAKKAFDLAQEVKAKEPNDPDPYLPIALYFRETGDFNAAILAIQRRIELQPKGAGGYNSLCVLKRESDDVAGAVAACKRSIELASHGRLPSESYNNLAHLAFRQDKLDEAIAWAQKSIDANPLGWTAFTTKAVSHARKGEIEQARKTAAEAMRIYPELRLANNPTFAKPWPGKEAEYKKFMDTQFLPAWRAAGLPE
ncbi:MAG: TIR domain-containing protein [Betaproteobacteria bacterium]|nr:TIR domain-containing protein [Betaproteobacteria bacterium]